MAENKVIELDKIYESKKVEKQPLIEYDKNSKKRPSWGKIKLNKKIIFIKILFNGEAFWYRRYFEDYFFPLEATSEDTKNFYNETAEKYEGFVPHQKEIAKRLIIFFKELNINKNSKILDLGAGTGVVTEEIVKENYKNITLLDISENELEIAREKESLKNADFVIADLTKEKIEGKYDLIIETLAFNELIKKDILTIFKNIRESLNYRGIFIMIDRHIYPELNSFFKEIKSGKFPLKTPGGIFEYYYFIGKK